MSLEFQVTEDKTFRDLCRDIIQRSESKKDQLDTLISDVRSLIKQPNDVQVFMPRIKELLEVGIKNDEQIIKLCAVVQKLQSTQIEASGVDSVGLSDDEKEQLMNAKLREIDKLNSIKEEVSKNIDNQ